MEVHWKLVVGALVLIVILLALCYQMAKVRVAGDPAQPRATAGIASDTAAPAAGSAAPAGKSEEDPFI